MASGLQEEGDYQERVVTAYFLPMPWDPSHMHQAGKTGCEAEIADLQLL